MESKQNFENLNVWKKARELCLFCYELVKNFPQEEKFGLSDQIRRAAISVPSNIAEGYSRKSVKDLSRFFYIAVGSIYELMTQIDIATEIGYVSAENKIRLFELSDESLKLINGFLNFKRKNDNG